MKSHGSKFSALQMAAMQGDVAAVQEAIGRGDDPNGRDRDGRTALFEAAIKGNVEVAAELVRLGSNVNIQDRRLETALHFAARECHTGVAKFLLDSGAEIDLQDENGNTALFVAVFRSRGKGEMIKLLLAHSADKRLANKHGVSPESLASSIANYEVSKYFG